MSRRSWKAGNWGHGRSGRARVLVENADGAEQWACEGILGRAGYEVAVCGGPDAHGAPCPLVERGECDLAAGADVIVNGFRLAEPRNQDVIRALRAHRPGTPLVVEAAVQEIERHADVLQGCTVASFPMTTAGLLEEVGEALAEGTARPS